MIDLKGVNANNGKKKEVTELTADISISLDTMGEKVNLVWGYIIHLIDKFSLWTLDVQDFRILVASNGASKNVL